MLYLIGQIALFIGFAMLSGVALGVVLDRFWLGRANLRVLSKFFPLSKATDVELMRGKISELELQIAEKDRAMKILASSSSENAGPKASADLLTDLENADDEDTGEVPLPDAAIPGAESQDTNAFKSQDETLADLSSKLVGAEFELMNARAQIKDQERLSAQHAQRIQELQNELARAHKAHAEPATPPEVHATIEALEREVAGYRASTFELTQRVQDKESEILRANARIDELEAESEKTRSNADLKEMEDYWKTASAEHEREKQSWQQIEATLRVQVEDLRSRLRSVPEVQPVAAAETVEATSQGSKRIDGRLEGIERYCIDLANSTQEILHQQSVLRRAVESVTAQSAQGAPSLWDAATPPGGDRDALLDQISALHKKLDDLKMESQVDASQLEEVAAQLVESVSDPANLSDVDLWGMHSGEVIPMKGRLKPVDSSNDSVSSESRLQNMKQVIEDRIESRLEEMSSQLTRLETKIIQARQGQQDLNPGLVRHLEGLIQEQERILESLKVRHEASPEIHALELRAIQLQKQLDLREARISELNQMAERSQHEERQLRHGLEETKRLLSQREAVIQELEARLRSVVQKVAPELTGDDDLKRIRGIGPVLEKMLRDKFGIKTYRQIAMMNPQLAEEISSLLYFSGKIQREDWVGQAIRLHEKKYEEVLHNEDPPYRLRIAI